jgi:hypothetical protein
VVGEVGEVGDLAIGGLVFGVVEMIMAFVLDSIESKLEGEVSARLISADELRYASAVGLSDSILSLPPD